MNETERQAGPQEQRAPASGRDRAVRPEPAERVPTQHLKVAPQEGTGKMALQGSTWRPEARNRSVCRAHAKQLILTCYLCVAATRSADKLGFKPSENIR